jgi:hypothetical protein
MNSLLKQQNLRRDLGVVSWKEADHDDKIEKLIDMNDILFERIVYSFSYLFLNKNFLIFFFLVFIS